MGLCAWGGLPAARHTPYLPWFKPGHQHLFVVETQLWNGVTFVLGFLIVFRSSMAYSRYWDGMTALYMSEAV